ncbi:hypothetical protein ARMSODRAFT_1023000 [Armillaria solidipes]|uniref:Uncharacterized protein n=1 Tax=Armillaria solidipes TaxID=1076256 RepID=A0A2H3B7A9_9AGAR|nr:hypothetical protein ARMSODRAFT_1023000 [Armillaria solidipes]
MYSYKHRRMRHRRTSPKAEPCRTALIGLMGPQPFSASFPASVITDDVNFSAKTTVDFVDSMFADPTSVPSVPPQDVLSRGRTAAVSNDEHQCGFTTTGSGEAVRAWAGGAPDAGVELYG